MELFAVIVALVASTEPALNATLPVPSKDMAAAVTSPVIEKSRAVARAVAVDALPDIVPEKAVAVKVPLDGLYVKVPSDSKLTWLVPSFTPSATKTIAFSSLVLSLSVTKIVVPAIEEPLVIRVPSLLGK